MLKPIVAKVSYVLIMFSYCLYRDFLSEVSEGESFQASENFADLKPNPTSEDIPIGTRSITDGVRRNLPEDVNLPFSRIVVYLLSASAIYLISSMKASYLRRARSHKIAAKEQLRAMEELLHEIDHELLSEFQKDMISRKLTAEIKEYHGDPEKDMDYLNAILMREIYELIPANQLDLSPIEASDKEEQHPDVCQNEADSMQTMLKQEENEIQAHSPKESGSMEKYMTTVDTANAEVQDIDSMEETEDEKTHPIKDLNEADMRGTMMYTEEEGHAQDRETNDSIDITLVDSEFSDGDQKQLDRTKTMKIEAANEDLTENRKHINLLQTNEEDTEETADSHNDEDSTSSVSSEVENEDLAGPQSEMASEKNERERGSVGILEHTGHPAPTRSPVKMGTVQKCHSEAPSTTDDEEERGEMENVLVGVEPLRDMDILGVTEDDENLPAKVQNEMGLLRTTKNTKEESHAQDQKKIDSIDVSQVDNEFHDDVEKELNWTKATMKKAKHEGRAQIRQYPDTLKTAEANPEETALSQKRKVLINSLMLELEKRRLKDLQNEVASVKNVGERGSRVILEHTGDPAPMSSPVKVGTIEKCHSETPRATVEREERRRMKNVPVGVASTLNLKTVRPKVDSVRNVDHKPNVTKKRKLHHKMPDYSKVQPRINTWR
jgi:hypothetical protein